MLHKAGIQTAQMHPDTIRQEYQKLKTSQTTPAAPTMADEFDHNRLAQIQATSNKRELNRRGITTDGMTDDAIKARLRAIHDIEKAEQAEANARRQAEWNRQRAEKLFAAASCPELHTHHLDTIDAEQNPKWLKIRDALASRIKCAEGMTVALLGNRGTGKTQIAVSVIHRACQGLMTARYIKALDLFRHVRRAYTPTMRGERGESEADLIDTLIKYDLLVIDESHQRGETDFEQNTLTNLLDHRYDARRCTILIANQTKAEFAAAVGDSITSRIHETGDALVCDWPTYRKLGSWLTVSGEKRQPSGQGKSNRYDS